MIRCIFHPFILKSSHKSIQKSFPAFPEPALFPELLYKPRAYCIICLYEKSSEWILCKRIISESAECLYLRTVIGAIDTGRNIASLCAVCIPIAAKCTRITPAYLIAVIIPIVYPPIRFGSLRPILFPFLSRSV